MKPDGKARLRFAPDGSKIMDELNMDNAQNKDLDDLFQNLEFPGEDPKEIITYLKSADFTEKTMKLIEWQVKHRFRAFFWIAFLLINLGLVIFFGTSRVVHENDILSESTFTSLIYLFLGLTLLGSVVGFFLSFDQKEAGEGTLWERLLDRIKRISVIRWLFR